MARIVCGDSTFSVVYYEDETKTRSIYPLVDPEMDLENVCELKHHMMTRSSRAGVIERELKPNASARNSLEKIIQVYYCYFLLTSILQICRPTDFSRNLAFLILICNFL